MVYLNKTPQRGLIIPPVIKVCSLFKLWQSHHKSQWVSDSRGQQNSIPPVIGPCSVWHWGAPCSSGVAVLTAALNPRNAFLKRSHDFSHEHTGLPRDTQGPGKSRTTVTYTTLPLPPHATTHSHTRFFLLLFLFFFCTCTIQTSQTWHVGWAEVKSQLSGALQGARRERPSAALFPPQWNIQLRNRPDSLCCSLCWYQPVALLCCT